MAPHPETGTPCGAILSSPIIHMYGKLPDMSRGPSVDNGCGVSFALFVWGVGRRLMPY